MTRIAPVKTEFSNKALWFDAGELEIDVEVKVVVKTARGIEFGTLADKIFEADNKQLTQLKSDLKPVLRIASDRDIARANSMKRKSKLALEKFKEFAKETNEDMAPIAVEYLMDGRKAIFYFSAPERQDFRELVKLLSAEFRIRVDMHQVNDREKASIVGGVGICGRELCCNKLGYCPNRITIKMAKSQGMSLGSESISGCCGKLLCCLSYEAEEYEEFVKRAPKLRAKIQTPEGEGVVSDLSMPKETVQIKYGEPEKRVRIPLEDMEVVKKNSKDSAKRPNTVRQEAWDKALQKDTVGTTEDLFTTIDIEGSDDELADGTVSVIPGKRRRERRVAGSKNSRQTTTTKRKRKNRKSSSRNKNSKKSSNKSGNNRANTNNANPQKKTGSYSGTNTSTRRRRTRTINSGNAGSSKNSKSNSSGSSKAKKPGQNW